MDEITTPMIIKKANSLGIGLNYKLNKLFGYN